jgi:D-tyrosyl-tRNA(Tyr) deacylase
MKAVVQRVTSASVSVGDRRVGSIGPGLLALIGVEHDDGPGDAEYVAGKIRDLRLFEDPARPGRQFELAVGAAGGAVLAVSQFTLAADCRRGRRPSFDAAAAPEKARPLYEAVVAALRRDGLAVETGEFQASMQVSLVNDGPVTLLVDSRARR